MNPTTPAALLPATDHEFLRRIAPDATVQVEAGMTCVVVPGFELPAGYTTDSSDLLLRLSPGYPDVAPDMWWFAPTVARADGREIPATQVSEVVLGRTWQRWSRHFNPGTWLAGTDTLESYVALVRTHLVQAAS
jgi:hypothetical protein